MTKSLEIIGKKFKFNIRPTRKLISKFKKFSKKKTIVKPKSKTRSKSRSKSLSKSRSKSLSKSRSNVLYDLEFFSIPEDAEAYDINEWSDRPLKEIMRDMTEQYILFYMNGTEKFSIIPLSELKKFLTYEDKNGHICSKSNSEWKEYYYAHRDMSNESLRAYFNENFIDNDKPLIAINTIFLSYFGFAAYISTKPIHELIKRIDSEGDSVCSSYIIYVDFEDSKKSENIVLLSGQNAPSGHSIDEQSTSVDIGVGIGKICEKNAVIQNVKIRKIK